MLFWDFIRGAAEFRLSATWSCDDDDRMWAYDSGRETAHKMTFRLFEA